MSQQPIRFISGPRIKVMLAGQTLAYAVGLNMSVSVGVQPVNLMGRYDAETLEPLSYGLVRGSMTVVKPKSDKIDNILFQKDAVSGISTLSHLNPATVLLSQTFDLVVKVAVPTRTQSAVEFASYDYLTIKDARITSHNGAISVAQILNETVSFEGLCVFDDATPTAEQGVDVVPGT